jgi:predicted RNase H-like nuclease (RuvC/YqgF family)
VQLELTNVDKTKELRSIEEALVQSNSDLKILPAPVDNIAEAIQHIAEAIRERDERIQCLEEFRPDKKEAEIRQRDEKIHRLEETIRNLEATMESKNLEIMWLKDFEGKVKNLFVYRLYRALRLHKLFK